MKLTSRQRIMRIFENKEIDRPAIKLWGTSFNPHLLNPAYDAVRNLALNISDLFIEAYSPFDIYNGRNADKQMECVIKDTDDPTWKEKHTTFHTKEGDLHSIDRISTIGEPSYTLEHKVKNGTDLKKLLSIDYEPFPINTGDYQQKQAQTGDRGVVMFYIDHAGYALHRLIGSENLAYFSVDYRDELMEIMQLFSSRVREFVKNAISAGIKGPFQWVGPEVFIPPLMSPRDFEDFVFQLDKPLCDDIHNAGGHVWVHSHGKVANFIQRYIDMGIDVINPLEPPKNGDICLESIISKFGNHIGWEGNIEIQDIIQSTPERLKDLIRSAVDAGNRSGRFILCPSAGYMEYPRPTRQYIDNLMLYLQYGLECVNKCALI